MYSGMSNKNKALLARFVSEFSEWSQADMSSTLLRLVAEFRFLAYDLGDAKTIEHLEAISSRLGALDSDLTSGKP